MVEKVSEADLACIQKDCTALIYIQAEYPAQFALRHAARRIRRNIRKSDSIIFLEATHACVILLPMTHFEGAQAVAQRISALLIHLQYDIQIIYGEAAQALIQRIQDDWNTIQAVVIEVSQLDMSEQVEMVAIDSSTYQIHKYDLLPYLSVLSSYPKKRLLQLFPYELACCYCCVPIGVERRTLTLATSQRLEPDILGLLRRTVQRNIFQVRCEADMIEDILQYWQKTLML